MQFLEICAGTELKYNFLRFGLDPSWNAISLDLSWSRAENPEMQIHEIGLDPSWNAISWHFSWNRAEMQFCKIWAGSELKCNFVRFDLDPKFIFIIYFTSFLTRCGSRRRFDLHCVPNEVLLLFWSTDYYYYYYLINTCEPSHRKRIWT